MPPRWARWFGLRGPDLAGYAAAVADWRKHEEERAGQRRRGFERVRQLLASLTSGYAMSLQRAERALKQHGLEAMPAVGQAFDPERMEAVEAVTDSGRPAGLVLDVILYRAIRMCFTGKVNWRGTAYKEGTTPP